jgi:hypothetical protein
VHGWSDVTAHPDVLAADLWVRPGGEVGAVTDSLDRHGVIVAAGGDHVLADLRTRLTFEVHAGALAA